MYQKERLDAILKEVKRYGYVTVKYLVGALHYSNATINRDLNALQRQGKILRTHGGVEYIDGGASVPLPFRYHKMHAEKLKIAKKASEFVKDGDKIFIDASTTTEMMAEFLVEKKDITVITNNVSLVTRLSEYGIDTICLGGRVVEKPCMLGGEETIESAMRYRVDKMFFATCCVCLDGRIGGAEYSFLHLTMANNADEIYYLADHDKVENKRLVKRFLFDLHKVNGIISDFTFPEETKAKYEKTQFIKV